MPRTRFLILVAALLVTAATASPATAATYRVVSLTHSSSASKTDEVYSGTSTATWRLAPATRQATNRFSIVRGGGILYGGGMINIRGTFTAQAITNRPASCSLTAPTGSTEYPAAAPAPFMFAVSKDPQGRTAVGFMAVHASLGNAYFGSECSTSLTGQPDGDTTSLKRVSPSIFKRRRVTLRFAGATNENGIAYRWSTVFKLKRVKR